MTERTTTVDVGGQPLLVREWGEPAAPPLVFLHGAGDDGAQAAPLAAALSDAARLVAPDLPGHGRSPAAAPGEYVPARVVGLLVRLLDEIGIDAAALAGFSWGASICCHVAARHPGRVRSVVLVEGGHIDFGDVRDVDPSALEPTGDVTAAMARGLVEDPVAATYPALRESSLPLLLVTAFRDEALSRLRIDPLQRLKTQVPQAEIARVAARGHDLLAGDDGTVVAMIRDWLAAQ